MTADEEGIRRRHGHWVVGVPCSVYQKCDHSHEMHVNGWGDVVRRHWLSTCRECRTPWPCPTIRALDV